MVEYRIFGLGPEQDVDLPEARWQFHKLSRDEVWGVDEHGRYQPVKITLDRDDHYRLRASWPVMSDVPEEVRWQSLSPSAQDPR